MHGPLTQRAFLEFRVHIIRQCLEAPAVIIRMDQAADVQFSPPVVSPSSHPPGRREIAVAITHRPEQRPFWTLYADSLTALGIRRALFDARLLDVARQWADQCAALHRQREPAPQG